MCTSSKKGDQGAGRAGPPQEGEKNPFTATNKPAPATASRDSTGPLVGPSRTRFHWATGSAMTWRHARWGHGILRGVELALTCPYMCCTSCPSALAPMLTARVGSTLQADFRCPFCICSILQFPFSRSHHETFGPLLAPAQTWLSSFLFFGDLRSAGVSTGEG